MKLNLQPGETLLLKLKGDEFVSNYEQTQYLKEYLEGLFPQNEILIMAIAANHDVELQVIKENKELACNTQSYCVDCNCGKKEQGDNNG